MIFKNTLFLSLAGSFVILFGSDITDIKEYINQNNGTFYENKYKSVYLGFLMKFLIKKMNVQKQKIIKKFVIILIIYKFNLIVEMMKQKKIQNVV